VDAASTTELMLEFHRNLRRSSTGAQRMSTAKALQLAATKMIADRESSHPFYWAGFVLFGDGR
jgi:CHAT domain-containing protein